MKLILVAAASLMTAGAAFGFARLADRLTDPAPIAAPQPIAAERVLRPHDTPRPAPANPSVASPAPTSPAATNPSVASAPIQADSVTPARPTPASGDRVARAVPSFQPAFQNMNHFIPPAADTGLDLPAPARRYEFETVPVIGVYR